MLGHMHAEPEGAETEARRAKRLARDLGINPAGVEVVLRLRRRIVELEDRVYYLEGELKAEQGRTEARLGRYRHEYYEAIIRSE
jgi:hypothetical protein